MKRILLLTTGGTIVCRKTSQGLRPILQGEDLMTPAVLAVCRPEIVSLMQIDSTDMRYPQMYRIAQVIWERSAEYDGFVITHGTDTMAYTAAFLSRILQNLGKPVILTGSMLPFGVADSDAEGNLTGAMICASSDYQGVGLYDSGRLFYGRQVTKSEAEKPGAFCNPHGQPDGVLNREGQLQLSVLRRPSGPARLLSQPSGGVMLIRLTPATQPAQLMADDGCQAVILEAFGAGGIPATLIGAVETLICQGKKVYMKSQCWKGGSDLRKYQVGHRALEMGVVDLGEITTEDALAQALCRA